MNGREVQVNVSKDGSAHIRGQGVQIVLTRVQRKQVCRRLATLPQLELFNLIKTEDWVIGADGSCLPSATLTKAMRAVADEDKPPPNRTLAVIEAELRLFEDCKWTDKSLDRLETLCHERREKNLKAKVLAGMHPSMHPNGRCRCSGQGLCEWCKKTLEAEGK